MKNEPHPAIIIPITIIFCILLTILFAIITSSQHPSTTKYEVVFDWDECRAEPPFETTQIKFNNNCNESDMIIIYLEVDFQDRKLYSVQVITNELPYDGRGGRFPSGQTYKATLYRANDTITFDFYLNQSYTNIIINQNQIWQITRELEEHIDENNVISWSIKWEHWNLIWGAGN